MARSRAHATRPALRCGIAVPILYYGVQLLAAPFFPHYSLLAHEASLLGSDRSRLPVLFNAVVFLTSGAMAAAEWGDVHGLRRLGVGSVATFLASAAILSGTVGSLNAGLFPLPDPRHYSGLLMRLSTGLFGLPLVLLIAFWTPPGLQLVRRYLAVNLALFTLFFVAMAPGVGSEAFQELLASHRGLVQRLSAATVFVPIGVCSYVLLKTQRDEARGSAAVART